MAGQRRGEPGRDLPGRRARRGGLAGLVALTLALSPALILSGCGGDPTGPSAELPTGGGGTSTTGDGASLLVGVWQATTIIEVPGDLQTWVTTWQFDSAGSCRQTVVTTSLAEGFPRTTERTCTWRTNGARVAISYLGGGTVEFAFSFAALSPDRLVLDGFEYQRQA
jgi:hypothetical protein